MPAGGSQTEPKAMARIAGALYLCGVVFVVVSLQLPHPAGMEQRALYAIAAIGTLGGYAVLVLASRARAWWIHGMIALGSVLVCLCIYFSDTAGGAYQTMFVWVVMISAFFFPGRPAAVHLAWLLGCYGVTLLAVDDPSGFSGLTRWLLTGFGLAIASGVTSWLVGAKIAAQRELFRQVAIREDLQRNLEFLAHHDPLTALANRRRFEQELERELARAARRHTPLCLIALDLDGLKAVNDQFGHAAGDRLLREAASAWQAELRAADLLARIGGDEFVALLPDCAPSDAERVAERLRRVTPRKRTSSIGIACWDRRSTPGALLAAADRAMYRAKQRRSPARTSAPARPASLGGGLGAGVPADRGDPQEAGNDEHGCAGGEDADVVAGRLDHHVGDDHEENRQLEAIDHVQTKDAPLNLRVGGAMLRDELPDALPLGSEVEEAEAERDRPAGERDDDPQLAERPRAVDHQGDPQQ